MKKILYLTLPFALVFLVSGCVQKEETPPLKETPSQKIKEQEETKKMADVLLIIADNYKEEEYTNTKKVLEDAGLTSETASSVANPKSTAGKTVAADVTLDKVDVSQYKAVVFIGGPGATVYLNDQNALKIAQEAVNQDKILAAICIAPVILANAGVLDGKKATVWDAGDRQTISKIEAKGAVFTDEKVVQDGKIITANGPAAATEFGKTIANVLK